MDHWITDYYTANKLRRLQVLSVNGKHSSSTFVKMPMKCSVIGCKSNYKLKDAKSEYVTVYRVLSECKGDDAKQETW